MYYVGRHPADFVCISHVWCVFMKACLLVYIFLARSVAFLLVVERVCEEILRSKTTIFYNLRKTFAEFRLLSFPFFPSDHLSIQSSSCLFPPPSPSLPLCRSFALLRAFKIVFVIEKSGRQRS